MWWSWGTILQMLITWWTVSNNDNDDHMSSSIKRWSRFYHQTIIITIQGSASRNSDHLVAVSIILCSAPENNEDHMIVLRQATHFFSLQLQEMINTLKNIIRDGGSTALYTTCAVDTVDMVYTFDIVYTIDTVYTIQTALHCLNNSMYACIWECLSCSKKWSMVCQQKSDAL